MELNLSFRFSTTELLGAQLLILWDTFCNLLTFYAIILSGCAPLPVFGRISYAAR